MEYTKPLRTQRARDRIRTWVSTCKTLSKRIPKKKEV